MRLAIEARFHLNYFKQGNPKPQQSDHENAHNNRQASQKLPEIPQDFERLASLSRGGGRDPLLAALIFFILLTPALSTNQLVSLQGRVLQSGSPATSGNIAVTIWNQVDNGTVLYSENFPNSINDGFFDLMLGSSSELNLTYGQFYYLDMYVDGDDINWTSPSGSTVNRIQFQSQNGQISTGMIQVNAVNTTIIQNDAVTAAKIAPSAVNSSHLNSAGTYYLGKLEIANISALPLNVSGVLFVNGTTSNVGIGTTSPDTKLELTIPDSVGNNWLKLSSDYSGGLDYATLGIGAQGVNLNLSGGLSTRFSITNGSVGIGTTSPTSLLHVSGAGTTYNTQVAKFAATSGRGGIIVETTDGSTANNLGGVTSAIQITNINDTNNNWAFIHFPLGVGTQRNNAGAAIGAQYITHAVPLKADLAFFTSDNGDSGVAERMRINASGYVGIGTANPVDRLDVYNDYNLVNAYRGITLSGGHSGDLIERAGIVIRGYNSSNANAFSLITGRASTTSNDLSIGGGGGLKAATAVHFYTAAAVDTTTGTERMSIDGNGNVGIASLASAGGSNVCYRTDVMSGFNVFSTCSSSMRYKENVSPLKVDKSRVFRLQPVSFKWKNRDERDVGLIAEDVEKLIPELVTYKNGTVEGVKYDQLTVYLLDIMKKQDNDIGNLNAENGQLKARLAALEARG